MQDFYKAKHSQQNQSSWTDV